MVCFYHSAGRIESPGFSHLFTPSRKARCLSRQILWIFLHSFFQRLFLGDGLFGGVFADVFGDFHGFPSGRASAPQNLDP